MERARRRGCAIMVVAIALASLASLVGWNYIQSVERQFGEMVRVVVAARNIPARTAISEDMLITKEIPKLYLAPSYYPVAQGQKPAEVLGAVVSLVDIRAGDYIQKSMVDRYAGLDPRVSELEPGLRAVTMDVNQVTSVGGTIRPGNRVDVVVTYVHQESEPEEGRLVTTFLLQDVLVLSVGYLLPPVEEGGPPRVLASGGLQSDATITFALSPEDALRLIYMENSAVEVRLILRHTQDPQPVPLPPVSSESFE